MNPADWPVSMTDQSWRKRDQKKLHPERGSSLLESRTSEFGRQARTSLSPILGRDKPPDLWPSRACSTCGCPKARYYLPERSVLTLPRDYQGYLDELSEEEKWTLEELAEPQVLRAGHLGDGGDPPVAV